MAGEGKKIKIMIVDDDKFLLDMYAKKFSGNGFVVETCSDAVSCLDKLRNDVIPNILVVDLIMPEMDGLSLLSIIKEEKLAPQTVNIVLTNQGNEDDLEKANALGVDGYIIKALNTPTEVVIKINNIFNKK